MGVPRVADVYRTLDKLSIRKEYHDALARAGLDLDVIVGGIKSIAQTAEKDDTRLKAYQTLLKSLGLEKYETTESQTGGTWEDELLKALEKKEETKILPSGVRENSPVAEDFIPEYVVEEPELPDSVKAKRDLEQETFDSIYG
jgi:hypothetical protein